MSAILNSQLRNPRNVRLRAAHKKNSGIHNQAKRACMRERVRSIFSAVNPSSCVIQLEQRLWTCCEDGLKPFVNVWRLQRRNGKAPRPTCKELNGLVVYNTSECQEVIRQFLLEECLGLFRTCRPEAPLRESDFKETGAYVLRLLTLALDADMHQQGRQHAVPELATEVCPPGKSVLKARAVAKPRSDTRKRKWRMPSAARLRLKLAPSSDASYCDALAGSHEPTMQATGDGRRIEVVSIALGVHGKRTGGGADFSQYRGAMDEAPRIRPDDGDESSNSWPARCWTQVPIGCPYDQLGSTINERSGMRACGTTIRVHAAVSQCPSTCNDGAVCQASSALSGAEPKTTSSAKLSRCPSKSHSFTAGRMAPGPVCANKSVDEIIEEWVSAST